MRAPDPASTGSGRTIPLASIELVSSAVAEVETALVEPTSVLRYARAQLAARRAAAAVLAARAQPRRGHRPQNVWQMLPRVAPELNEWADFFLATSGHAAAAQAGISQAVSRREADDMVRDARNFLDRVIVSLSRSHAAI